MNKELNIFITFYKFMVTVFTDVRYVSLDNPEIMEYAKRESCLFFKTYNPPIVLDEVQYAPELHQAL